MSIKKHIPNSITLMNLLCGAVGVIFTFENAIDAAFILMLAAAVFDFCDGLAARLLKAYSDTGKELDSLSDMVSFGLLPSLMLYSTMRTAGSDTLLCYIPLLIALASALRLAKFNIDERQHSSFLGLPTPACAIICGSLSYYIFAEGPFNVAAAWWFIPVLSVVLGLLLVSEIPMFSMKFGGDAASDKRTGYLRIAFLAISALIVISVPLLRQNWSLIPLGIFTMYVLINLLAYKRG